MCDGSDEPYGLLALLTYLGQALLEPRTPLPGPRASLLLPALLMLGYSASVPIMPKLIQAVLAVLALGCTMACLRRGRMIRFAEMGLLLLSLPLIASLQFYAGYPLRVVSGAMAVPLLKVSGFAVVLEGTCLRWGTELIAIDAGCSGVHMLWVGLYVAFALCAVQRFSCLRTLLMAFAALGLVLAGNALRAAALFHMEAGIVALPGWCHEGVGAVIFTAVVIALGILSSKIRVSSCAIRSCT
jgi:exosortase/archaeosortase family protein